MIFTFRFASAVFKLLMKKVISDLLAGFFLLFMFFRLPAQTNEGRTFHFTSQHTSFPDTGRAMGHVYDSVLYDAATHYSDNSVLVLVPPHFSADKKVDMAFWFHGWRNNIDTAIVFYELGKQFINSKTNAVLVMAETAKNSPDSYGGKLEQPGMFPLLVTDVLKQLKQRKIIARKATVDAITLAGHSGGYRVMAKILQNVNLPIHKVFLFDALYANESEYMNWIKQDTKNVFVNLYTDGGGTDKLTIEFMEQLKAGNIPFLKKEEADLTDVDIKNNRLIFVHSLHEHNYIINNPDNFQRFLMLTQ
jgi:hypothetical protein